MKGFNADKPLITFNFYVVISTSGWEKVREA
jgi:hypothetical protein